MTSGKNGFGFGVGLGGLLLIAAAPWLGVALQAVPYFLESLRWISRATLLGLQIGVSGLIAGWFTYEVTRRIAKGILRVATMTLLAIVSTAVLSCFFSLCVRPFSSQILVFYLLVLPTPCLVIVPLWAAVYLRLIRLQESLEQAVVAAQRKARMARLLEDLRKQG
ncbi:hypothetical protein [Enhydrobacter sp.]|jgi:cytochrome bd-type quinol oxidase subunit 1|uniref:hypothetical protein n=1 Tax=Enhydrobacter sp. TaxID=1894999 RepID=UPI0026216947|nr:hypothetical protein [Enhydrobacter sp.]WIM10204.1 MAG: hypothetical protein OJF58_001159 [Enhydrobacter sp.]